MKEYLVTKMPLRNMQEATDLLNGYAKDGFEVSRAVQLPPDVIVFLEKDVRVVSQAKAEPKKVAKKSTKPKED